MADTCYAPMFKPAGFLACLIRTMLAILLLPFLWIAFLVSGGSRAVMCEIKRLQFRIKHCGRGNSDPAIDLMADAYTLRVRNFRALYGKDSAWELWMESNRNRYLPVFNAATAAPRPITLAFAYDTTPIAYNPPWANEAEH